MCFLESMNLSSQKTLCASPFNNPPQSNTVSTINLPLDAIQIYLTKIQ